jgi:uncharacterized membrane protein
MVVLITLVRPQQSLAVQAKLITAGVANQYVFYPTGGHGDWDAATYTDTFNKIQAFFAINKPLIGLKLLRCMKYTRHYRALWLLFIVTVGICPLIMTVVQTQNGPILAFTTRANREKTFSLIIQNGIGRNLAMPLADSTETNWQDAMNAMEVVQFKANWIQKKINTAFEYFPKASPGFQRAFLEFLYCLYPREYSQQVNQIRFSTKSNKILSLCFEYLLQAKK